MNKIQIVLILMTSFLMTFEVNAQDLFTQNSGDTETISGKYQLKIMTQPTPGEQYKIGVYDNSNVLITSLDIQVVNNSGDLEIQIRDDQKSNTGYENRSVSDIDGKARYGGMYSSNKAGTMAFKTVADYVKHFY